MKSCCFLSAKKKTQWQKSRYKPRGPSGSQPLRPRSCGTSGVAGMAHVVLCFFPPVKRFFFWFRSKQMATPCIFCLIFMDIHGVFLDVLKNNSFMKTRAVKQSNQRPNLCKEVVRSLKQGTGSSHLYSFSYLVAGPQRPARPQHEEQARLFVAKVEQWDKWMAGTCGFTQVTPYQLKTLKRVEHQMFENPLKTNKKPTCDALVQAPHCRVPLNKPL